MGGLTTVLLWTLWFSIISLPFAVVLNAQLGGGAAGTAITSMWGQIKVQRLIDGAKSARTETPSASPASTPALPVISAQPSPANFSPVLVRQDVTAFSAQLPSTWIFEISSGHLWAHPKTGTRKRANGQAWYDAAIDMAFFGRPEGTSSPSDLLPGAKAYLRLWASHDNVQLPDPVDFVEVQTPFGSGMLAMFSHPTEFTYEEVDRFLFLLRPSGVFVIAASTPLNSDSIDQDINRIYASLHFRDQIPGERVQEFLRK